MAEYIARSGITMHNWSCEEFAARENDNIALVGNVSLVIIDPAQKNISQVNMTINDVL